MSDRTKAKETGTALTIVRADRQRHLLTEPIVYEEETLPGFVRVALLSVAALMVLILAWSSWVEVEELAVAPGQVVPSGAVKQIQHLEGGVVAQVLVNEGELVNAGQVLLLMDEAAAAAEYEQMKAREATLLVRAERLKATVEQTAPDFSPWEGKYPQLVVEQRRALNGLLATQRSALAIIDTQIAQRNKELKQLQDSLGIAEKHLSITAEQMGIREKGVEAGIVSRQVYLETKRAWVTAQGEVARMREQIQLSREALAESERRRQNLEATQRQEALNEAGNVVGELVQVRGALGKLEDRVNRLEVRAPAAGIVQDLRVRTPGEVVHSGALIMKVVPIEDRLEAEVRIATADIGHVRAGQPVKLKVATYDFTRYGAIDGELVRLSPTTFLDEGGRPYYKGVVRLARTHMGTTPGVNPILPGMTVEADIVTGDKTLLEYLLKPIHLALKNAFHER